MFTCYFVDMIAMSTTTFMIDFDMNIYHVHELHAISQRRHISEYIPHIYIHLHKICFPNGLRKKSNNVANFHVVRDLQARVGLSGCELMSSCLPPTLDALEGSGIADRIDRLGREIYLINR